MGVEGTSGKLLYTMDGQPWGTVKSPHVPKEPVEFDMQTQAAPAATSGAPCPNDTTPSLVEMQVDWVEAYAYNGR